MNDKDISEIAVLGSKLQHIDESIITLSGDVKTILEKLSQQNGDLIKAKTEIDYLKKEVQSEKEKNEKEINEVKELQEKSKNKIWEELRRKETESKEERKAGDVKQRWWVTTIMGGIVIVWSFISYLLK